MDAGPAVMPTLAALRAARAHQDTVRRWLRPAGPVIVLVLTLSAVQSAVPLGRHPGMLPAIAAFAVGGLGAMVTRTGPARLQLTFVVVLFAGALGLVAVQPAGTGVFGLLIGIALAAPHLRRRGARVVTGAIFVLMGVVAVGVAGYRAPLSGVLAGVAISSFVGLSLLATRLRDANLQAERLLIELEQTRQANARAAALAERQRMAREIHDVLAHSLSGLVVQLDAAQMLVGTGDPRLTPTISRARHLAQSGLDETRQAIGTLRDDEMPGPELLGRLVADYRQTTGIACDLAIVGPERKLEPQIGLAIYRVAQEALTNAAKHARPDRVAVRLAFGETTARLTVEDTGAPAPAGAGPDRPGFGLIGMRERAELLGGTLDAGRTAGGFRVDLVVPG